MGVSDDLIDKMRMLRGHGYVLPSDLEMIVKELMYLKGEIDKIKKALKKHGITVD